MTKLKHKMTELRWNKMKYSKDYFTGMKHLADAINYELDKKSLHNEMIKANYLDDDYYEGIAKGLKEAHSIVHKVLSMQLEVKEGSTE